MKLTKYEHACFTLEKDGKTLVVDPGTWTNDFVVAENVIAVVITHEHADHFDPNKLAAIYNKNPESLLITLEDIAQKMPNHTSQSVNIGSKLSVGPFELEFFGGNHAVIHPDYDQFANLGVLINETLYYPGDSLAVPDKPVRVLALPVTAPWLKVSEAIDFMRSIEPELVFPTHDAIASEDGKALVDRLVGSFAEKSKIKYHRIVDPIEV